MRKKEEPVTESYLAELEVRDKKEADRLREYIRIKNEKNLKIAQVSAKKSRMVTRIMELCSTIKPVSKSKLSNLSIGHLTAIGLAAKGLNEALDKAGLFAENKFTQSNKWNEYI